MGYYAFHAVALSCCLGIMGWFYSYVTVPGTTGGSPVVRDSTAAKIEALAEMDRIELHLRAVIARADREPAASYAEAIRRAAAETERR